LTKYKNRIAKGYFGIPLVIIVSFILQALVELQKPAFPAQRSGAGEETSLLASTGREAAARRSAVGHSEQRGRRVRIRALIPIPLTCVRREMRSFFGIKPPFALHPISGFSGHADCTCLLRYILYCVTSYIALHLISGFSGHADCTCHGWLRQS